MRRMLCLCNTCLLYTRVIQKDRVYPILNNWYDDKSKMKTVVEDRRSSRCLGDYWWSWLGCTPKKMETVSDRPDVLGDRWICEESASGFVQTQNELVNGLCVWHWILFCVDWSLLNIHLFGGGEFILLLNALLWDVRAQRLYIDGHQSHGVNCLCGMLRCSDQGFCWKAKSCGWWSMRCLCGIALCNVDSRASHPSCEPETGEDIREGMHFLLARSGVSGFTRPDEFDLCGCCCCEAPRIYQSIRDRWSHSLLICAP